MAERRKLAFFVKILTVDRSFSNDIHQWLHFARKPPLTGPSDTQIAQKPLPGSPSAWKAKERPRSPYKKFEFSTLEVSRSSSRASLHVIVTFTMDPLAVLAGMDAMDAAGVPVEEIPDSDGEFDDRSLEGSDVDVLSSDEEELLDDQLLGDGTSSGASGDSSQSGTEDSDEDSDEQNDGGAVRGRGR